MNWNKVTNVLILIFLVINIILFFYKINYESNRYTLPDDRDDQVKAALNNAGILIYEFVPQYYPKRQIELEAPVVDEEEIRKRILGDNVQRKPDENLGERIFNDYESLTFYVGEQDGYIYYKSEQSSYVPKDMTLKSVDEIALKFAEDLYGSEIQMEVTFRKEIKQDIENEMEKGYRIELNEVYKDQTIFQSYIKLFVTQEGIKEALAVRFQPVDYVGTDKNIYPFDEVMYGLMYYLEDELKLLKKNKKDESKVILDIDVGYFMVDVDRRRYLYQLDPYYRIIFESGETYYINAYTNIIYTP